MERVSLTQLIALLTAFFSTLIMNLSSSMECVLTKCIASVTCWPVAIAVAKLSEMTIDYMISFNNKPIHKYWLTDLLTDWLTDQPTNQPIDHQHRNHILIMCTNALCCALCFTVISWFWINLCGDTRIEFVNQT